MSFRIIPNVCPRKSQIKLLLAPVVLGYAFIGFHSLVVYERTIMNRRHCFSMFTLAQVAQELETFRTQNRRYPLDAQEMTSIHCRATGKDAFVFKELPELEFRYLSKGGLKYVILGFTPEGPILKFLHRNRRMPRVLVTLNSESRFPDSVSRPDEHDIRAALAPVMASENSSAKP